MSVEWLGASRIGVGRRESIGKLHALFVLRRCCSRLQRFRCRRR